MSKRKRREGFTPNKKFPFKTCLSDGITEAAIESYFKSATVLKETVHQLENNQISAFRTSDVSNHLILTISPLLKTATQLKRLILVQGTLNINSIKLLCQALVEAPHIIHLDLRANELTEESISCLISILPETKISTLNLAQNNVNLQSFSLITKPIYSLSHVILDGNSFYDGSKVLPIIIEKLPVLIHLSLVDCNLYGKDIESLINPLRTHSNISSIHLCCNPIQSSGILALVEIIKTSISLQEISLIGINYSEIEAQLLVHSIANRIYSTLKISPTILSRRAHYVRKLYPGKDALTEFLTENKLDQNKELFYRFEITIESLRTNHYLLQSLEKYQLSIKETNIIQRAILYAQCKDSREIRRRRNTVKLVSDKIFEHLLITDINVKDQLQIRVNDDIITLPQQNFSNRRDRKQNETMYDNNRNCDYKKAIWFSETDVLYRDFICKDITEVYALQAAANRLFRLRHPYLLDFLGIFMPLDLNNELRQSHLQLVFENVTNISILDWIYSSKGKEL